MASRLNIKLQSEVLKNVRVWLLRMFGCSEFQMRERGGFVRSG